jgi:hypothetical protein
MGERKVLNKYFPSDFDPSLIPRGKKLSKKDGTVPVRMMLPFSVQCSTCMTFLYRGTKFNSKKEPMGGPDGRYLGIQRFRFYIKCTLCSRTISFLTDPQNTDYEMENGGTRNYEVYKDKEKKEEETLEEKEQDEKEDPMKALENRVLDSQREMKELDDLEEIRAMNRKHIGQLTDINAVLDSRHANKEEKTSRPDGDKEVELNEHGMTEEEEKLVSSIIFGRTKIQQQQQQNYNNNDDELVVEKKSTKTTTIMRLNEDDEKREEEKRKKDIESIQQNNNKKKEMNIASIRPKIKLKRKKIISTTTKNNTNNNKKKQKKEDNNVTSTTTTTTKTATTSKENGLAGLLGGYGSSSSSDNSD